jgi:hypothetical protein
VSDVAVVTHAASGKATPVDADELPLVDSAASNVLKKLTWANLKTAIGAWYDTAARTITNKTITSPTVSGGTFTAPTLSATTNAAVLSADLQPAMSTWTLSGNASYSAGPPEKVASGAGAGSIVFPVSVVAGDVIVVEWTGTFTAGDYTVQLGAATAASFAWNTAAKTATWVVPSTAAVNVTFAWTSFTGDVATVGVKKVATAASAAGGCRFWFGVAFVGRVEYRLGFGRPPERHFGAYPILLWGSGCNGMSPPAPTTPRSARMLSAA